jgi:hypothetical protein
MCNEHQQEAIILLDLKKRRIRIHEKTLRALHEPEYIVLLVHPEERTIAIMRSNASEKRAHRIPPHQNRKKSYELYSTYLVQCLRELNPEWRDSQKYRFVGHVVDSECMVLFQMSDATPIGDTMVDDNQ